MTRRQIILTAMLSAGFAGQSSSASPPDVQVELRPATRSKPPVGTQSGQETDGPIAPPPVISDVLPKDLVLPLSPNAVLRRTIITAGQPRVPGGVQAASSVVPTGTLVYSSTLGKSTFGPAQNTEIADDIIHTGSDGCLLDAFSFKVAADKRDNKASVQPPITVTYALNSLCPGSTFFNVTIPGTTGTVVLNPQCVGGPSDGADCTSSLDCGVCQNDGTTPCTAATQDTDCGTGQLCDAGVCDDVVHEIVVEIPAGTGIPIPNTVYLSLEFDQSNVAAVVGAPPTLGFSQDVIDTPSFTCNSSIGGFPTHAYGSFHSQLWVRGACARSFVSYRDSNQRQSNFTPGAGILFADEIKLGAIPCNMVAYEVSLKGSGRSGAGSVQSELHTVLDDAQPDVIGLIPGSRAQTFVRGSSKAFVKRVEFDPSVPINQDLFAVFTTNTSDVGPIATCAQASPGTTPNTYAQHDGTEWVKTLTLPGCFSAFDVTIYCGGAPIPGACCDMIITENATCIAGPKDGEPCQFSIDCACDPDDPLPCKDGRCVGEAVCREVSELNCAFPEMWAPTGRCGPICYGRRGETKGEHCKTNADCPKERPVCGSDFCVGGPHDGEPCSTAEACMPDGVCGGSFCEGGVNDGKGCAMQSDCPGGRCDNQHFKHGISCGQAACCHFDQSLNAGEGDLTCDDVTERECFLFPPLDKSREFQRLNRCGMQGQRCPLSACVDKENDCSVGAEDSRMCVGGTTPGRSCDTVLDCEGDGSTCASITGCRDSICCTEVCNAAPSCCITEWGSDCAQLALQTCGEQTPGAPLPEGVVVAKNRYLSFVPNDPGRRTALQVTLVLSEQFPSAVGLSWWVGPPQTFCENSAQNVPPLEGCGPGGGGHLAFTGANLQCSPHCTDWGRVGLVHVFGRQVVPDAAYQVRAILCSSNLQDPTNFSSPLLIPTPKWADLCGPSVAGACTAGPDGIVDFANDLMGVLDKFTNSPTGLVTPRSDLSATRPTDWAPDQIIDITDIMRVIDAFRGVIFPGFPGPFLPCP